MAARRLREPGRRALTIELLEVRCLLSAGLELSGALGNAGAKTLADLPVAAQHAISSAIGQDQSAYHAASGNAIGARGPSTIDPFVQEAKLTASGGQSNDFFGASVAISGNTVVVGVVGANDEQGAAYVFTEPASGWSGIIQVAKLTASDGQPYSHFGYSVAISGNTVVVGAPQAQVAPGVAYVFTEPASGWKNMTQTAELTASKGSASAWFGCSVSISGNTVVVGAKWATVGGNSLQGRAYVFTEPASGWTNMTQTAKLTASDGAASDYFGLSVSISGNTVVVGAEFATYIAASGPGPGAAYVFTEPASGWADMTQTAKLTASDGAVGDEFGYSVSISGNTVVVGAPFPASISGAGPGAAYVFTEPASGWANMPQTAKLTASDGVADDQFGSSVSISGNTVVVGASGANSQQGAAYVFTEPASGWADMTQPATLTASDGAAYDYFGGSVSISGDTVVVGAKGAKVGANSQQGAAYVFERPPTVMGVSSTRAAGTYAVGTPITITVTFGDPVTVTGMPQLALNAGSGAVANYTGGSGTSTLTFTYTVAAGQNSSDLDYASTAALGLNGGSIYDVLGNSAVLDLPTPGTDGLATQNIVIETTTVTGVRPSAGPLAGGMSVTITGQNLAHATRVLFGAKAARIERNTDTQLVVVSPAGKAGPVDVTVVTAKGTSATSALDQFTYVAAPLVTKISLAAGPTAGGTQVTISGVNLAGATAVYFGKVKVTTPLGSTPTGQILATSPASPAGKAGIVDVTVVTAGGASKVSAADKFTYVALPAVTRLAPAAGPLAGGTLVTITGTNLLNFTAVKFGNTAATSFVSKSATRIVVKSPPIVVPAGTSADPVSVTVTTVGGTSAISSADQFTFVAAPTVGGLLPASGGLNGGTLVTISGTNLAGATAVHFGKVLAKIKSTADTQIVVTSPAGRTGPVDVTVTTPGGTSAPSALYQFTYAATTKAPAIITSGAIAPDASDLALLALAGQSGPSATLQRKTVDNLMASLL